MSGEGTGNSPEQIRIQGPESSGSNENVAMRGDVLSMPSLAGAFEAMTSTNNANAEKSMEENGFPAADLFKEFLNQAEKINADEKAMENPEKTASNTMPVPIEDDGTFDASPVKNDNSKTT